MLNQLDGIARQILCRLILPRQQQGADLVDQHPSAVHVVAEQIDIEAAHGIGILFVVPQSRGAVFQGFLVVFVVFKLVNQPKGDKQLPGVLVVLKFQHTLYLGGQGDDRKHIVVDVHGVPEEIAAHPAQIRQGAPVGDDFVQPGLEIPIPLKNGLDLVEHFIDGPAEIADVRRFARNVLKSHIPVGIHGKVLPHSLRNQVEGILLQLCLAAVHLQTPQTGGVCRRFQGKIPKKLVQWIGYHLDAQEHRTG